ncbi:AraC family transcriptional regulator [Parasalinivibrio latis]|uniref:AraC family transcriptional regulator n=1 Tax=Parasalinivibrio latis TaxID=2952610 RepID=UPI0030E10B7B
MPERQFPPLSDPLGETLYQLRLNGSLYCYSELTAPWGIDMPALDDKMMIHIVTEGTCWLRVGSEDPVQLQSGHLALVPKGQGHSICDQMGSPLTGLFDIPVTHLSERYEIMKHGGGGETTRLTCGVVSFDHAAGRQLIQQLPHVLTIDSWDDGSSHWLQSLLRFIALEAKELKPGGETVITHLADILVIQAIRNWVDHAPEARTGWFAALRDRKIGAALTAIHRQPEAPWTVDSLAREAGMSRSGFSARFTDLVGDTVKHYLTRWRMQVATVKLKHGNTSITTLSEELGYHSEAAFSRAFKRVTGYSPGHIQRQKVMVDSPHHTKGD